VLVRAGKIAEVYDGAAPDDSRAEVIEAAGKTLLPGLIDAGVHLTAPGGIYAPKEFEPVSAAGRALAAYLYCGVTGVRSEDDPPAIRTAFEKAVASGQLLGAEVFEPREKVVLPMLAMLEAAADLKAGNPAPLERGLVQQVAPQHVIAATRAALARDRQSPPPADDSALREAGARLLARYRAGAPLVAASGGGAALVLHGPGLQRELELWVKAGIPPRDALLAATANAARLVGAANRVGSIRAGHDADLLIVDGNPLEDIAALERVSVVIFKGERIERAALFEQQ
jgi:imidazolonepropionase-like amidohydrolase